MAIRSDGKKTYDRILDAASDVFARQGYDNATINDICNAADINIAAVNYHFGSKEQLYIQVWKAALEHEQRANPPHGNVPPSAPPAERLAGRIRAMVRRFLGSSELPVLALLITRELVSPTTIIDRVRRDTIVPLHLETNALIREILGPDATDRDVLFAEHSILQQCLSLGLRRGFKQIRQQVRPQASPEACEQCPEPGTPTMPMQQLFHYLQQDGGVDALVEHITAFSLAGLQAVKMNIQQRCPQPEAEH